MWIWRAKSQEWLFVGQPGPPAGGGIGSAPGLGGGPPGSPGKGRGKGGGVQPVTSGPLITAFNGELSVVSLGANLGLRFTVGSTPLSVSKLRLYAPLAENYAVRVWRVNGTMRLVQQDVMGSPGEWVESDVSPFTMNAGEDYVISMRSATVSENVYRATEAPSFSPHIGSPAWVWSTSNTLIPSTSGNIDGFTDLNVEAAEEGDGRYALLSSQPDSPSISLNGAQNGWEFTALQDLDAVALRVWTSGVSTMTLRLWAVSGSELLAVKSVSNIQSVHTEVALDSPIRLSKDANYVVSARAASSVNMVASASSGFSFQNVTYVQGRWGNTNLLPGNLVAGEVRGAACCVVKLP